MIQPISEQEITQKFIFINIHFTKNRVILFIFMMSSGKDMKYMYDIYVMVIFKVEVTKWGTVQILTSVIILT